MQSPAIDIEIKLIFLFLVGLLASGSGCFDSTGDVMKLLDWFRERGNTEPMGQN